MSAMAILMAVVLASCGGNEADHAQGVGPAAKEVVPTPYVQVTHDSLPGGYAGTLPCGDCNGVVTRLELLADGTYKVNEKFDGKGEGAMLDSDGKWSLDVGSGRVTLDPAAQDWEDRLFDVLSNGSLRPLDGNGTPYSTEGTNDLARTR